MDILINPRLAPLYLVREELNARVGAEGLAPGLHHKGVVARDAEHLVDALRLDQLALLHVARDVAGGADCVCACMCV